MDMNHFIPLLSIIIEKQKQTVNQKTVCYKLEFTKIFFESYTAIYYK